MSAAYLMLAMSAISAGSQVGAGVSEQRQARADARGLEKIGEIEAEQARKRGRRLAGRQRAQYAKAGVDVALGTPLEVLGETAFETELDALRRKWGYDEAADRRKREGKKALTSGIFGGISTLLGGAAMASQSGLFTSGGGSAATRTGLGSPSVGAPTHGGGFNYGGVA